MDDLKTVIEPELYNLSPEEIRELADWLHSMAEDFEKQDALIAADERTEAESLRWAQGGV